MREHVERIRHSWAITGCSILFDGWIDQNGRNLGPIYLRSSDVSTAIDDVDALQLLLAGVVEKGSSLWSAKGRCFGLLSASCCIELMLEKNNMMDFVRGILDKPKISTRFLHSHATVLKLFKDYSGGHELIKPCKTSGTEGNRVVNQVKYRSGLEPGWFRRQLYHLLNVPCLINRADKPQVGDIHCDEEIALGLLCSTLMIQEQQTKALISRELDKYKLA
ncbi:hypothetical protein ACOSQ3_024510 [Xanthoceras sorbifolium]